MAALFDRTITLGKFTLANPVFVAPMAGVTDRPYRQLCKQLGAGYAVSEMAASNPKLWATIKTSRRLNHDGETDPKAVQIAGADPHMMAEAARFNVARGAQIIDINMGCPAKKVCNVMAGSALMADEALALKIIDAVVRAVDVPVTLKMRTGPHRAQRNALSIAKAAQSAGVQMLTIHGRTRADAYLGEGRNPCEVERPLDRARSGWSAESTRRYSSPRGVSPLVDGLAVVQHEDGVTVGRVESA